MSSMLSTKHSLPSRLTKRIGLMRALGFDTEREGALAVFLGMSAWPRCTETSPCASRVTRTSSSVVVAGKHGAGGRETSGKAQPEEEDEGAGMEMKAPGAEAVLRGDATLLFAPDATLFVSPRRVHRL